MELSELKEVLGADSVEYVESKEPEWRRIVIETDGNNIRVSEAKVAGNIELAAILRALLDQFRQSSP